MIDWLIDFRSGNRYRVKTHEVVVDFVGDNRKSEPLYDMQNVLDVLKTEDRSTRVRRIVDDHGDRVVVDLGYEIIEVDLPWPLRLNIRADSHVYHTLAADLITLKTNSPTRLDQIPVATGKSPTSHRF